AKDLQVDDAMAVWDRSGDRSDGRACRNAARKLRNNAGSVMAMVASTAPKPAQIAPRASVANTAPVEARSPTTPTTYGIYAVSGDELYELEMLPRRAPDIRIAVSPAIQTPSRTVLPNGHLKFVVYRRDSATSAADRAEVRVIAKITREMSFDPVG